MFKELVASTLLSFIVGAKPLTAPVKYNAYNTSVGIQGGFTLQDSFSLLWDYFFDYFNEDSDRQYVYGYYLFDKAPVDPDGTGNRAPDDFDYCCPLQWGDAPKNLYYLQELRLEAEPVYWADEDEDIDNIHCNIEFRYYRYDGSFTIEYWSITDEDDVDDVVWFIADSFKTIYTFGLAADLFNAVFSFIGNRYVTTYTGYYNLNNNLSSMSTYVFLAGNINLSNSLYLGLTTRSNSLISRDDFSLYYYDVNNNSYDQLICELPITENSFVTTTQFNFLNVMMSRSVYNLLSTYGAFGYVRDTSFDNANFEDLLFSIMDSPIYFLTRLLSFELFGVNLFIAFTGLLTICAILLLIRKFW